MAQTSKDYEMKKTVSTPVPTTNRFSPLQDFPPLSYSQITKPTQPLPSPSKLLPAKEKSSPLPSPSTSLPAKEKSSYFLKPISEHIVLTKYKDTPVYSDIVKLTKKIFPTGCQWCPDDITKTQNYYELILIDSQSVDIIKKPDPNKPSEIAHCKCIIKKVLPPSEWSFIHSKKDFTVRYIPDGYTYEDYKQAWFRAFLLRPFNHSWFFIFSENCTQDFPIWFYHWWLFFGPEKEIYPTQVALGLETFSKNTHTEEYTKPVLFHQEFKVPWIFCWSYNISQTLPDPLPMSLIRDYKIKWWDGFMQEICSPENVTQFIKTGIKLKWSLHQLIKVQTRNPTPTPRSSTQKSSPSAPPAPSNSESLLPEDKDPTHRFLLAKVVSDPALLKDYIAYLTQQEDKGSVETTTVASSSSTPEDPIGGQDPYEF